MVEIGCIELVNRVETGNSFHAYFNPERLRTWPRRKCNGLMHFWQTSHSLKTRLRSCSIFWVIHRWSLIMPGSIFRFSTTNSELAGDCTFRKLGWSIHWHWPASGIRVQKHSLDALCTRYGIDRSHRVKHGALLDAQLLSQIYVELTGGRSAFRLLIPLPRNGRAMLSQVGRLRQSQPLSCTSTSANGGGAQKTPQIHRTLSNPLWLGWPVGGRTINRNR